MKTIISHSSNVQFRYFLWIILSYASALKNIDPTFEIYSPSVMVFQHKSTQNRYQQDLYEGVSIKLSPQDFVGEPTIALSDFSRMFCWSLLKHHALSNHEQDDCKVYNEDGKLISYFADISEGDNLFVVPKDRHFVWPSVKKGNTRRIAYEPGSHISGFMELETLYESPSIFRVHNFLTESDIWYLLNFTQYQKFTISTEGKGKAGTEQASGRRTSESIYDTDSSVANQLKHRALHLLRIGEPADLDDIVDGLQIVRYSHKQYYVTHTDFFPLGKSNDWNWNPAEGGSNRFATLFIYLKEPEQGGETVFEYLDPEESATETIDYTEIFDNNYYGQHLSSICQQKFTIKLIQGDALLWYNTFPNGRLDERTLHGGCPVYAGEKLGVNLWIWNKLRYGRDKQVTVTFINDIQQLVFVYWAARSSEQTFVGQILPSEAIQLLSYAGHVFVVKIEKENTIFATFSVPPVISKPPPFRISRPQHQKTHEEL